MLDGDGAGEAAAIPSASAKLAEEFGSRPTAPESEADAALMPVPPLMAPLPLILPRILRRGESSKRRTRRLALLPLPPPTDLAQLELPAGVVAAPTVLIVSFRVNDAAAANNPAAEAVEAVFSSTLLAEVVSSTPPCSAGLDDKEAAVVAAVPANWLMLDSIW